MNQLTRPQPNSSSIPAAAWLFVMLLLAIEVLAAPFAAATLDTARDLYWALQIASGQEFPILGPRIADRFHLTSFWFYLLALPLLFFGSLNAVSAWVGLLGALQYPLALLLGTRVLDWRLGCLLAAMLALPSLASYTLVTWTHISIAGTTILLSGLALQQDWRYATRWSAVLLGLSIALMIQAHPTLLALSWPVVICWWRGKNPFVRGLLIGLPPSLCLLLMYLSLGENGYDSSRTTTDALSFASMLEAPGLIFRSLVYGSEAAIHLAATNQTAWIGFIQWLLVGLAIIALSGLGKIFLSRPTTSDRQCSKRTLALFSIALIVVYGLLVSVMRPFTWWYMMLGIIPPAALLLALGLHALHRWLQTLAMAMAGIWCLFLSAGLIALGSQGISHHFPVGFMDLKQARAQQDADDSPWMPLYGQEQLARFMCTDTGTVTLHGTVAFVLDPTGRLLQSLHCPDTEEWRILGPIKSPDPSSHWLGIREIAALQAGLDIERTYTGMALTGIDRVLFPERGLAIGNPASEKLRGWAEETAGEIELTLDLYGDQKLAIGNAFFWQARPEWLKIEANGKKAQMLGDDGVTQIYACADCSAEETAEWTIVFRAAEDYPPDIVVLERPPKLPDQLPAHRE